MAKAKKIKPIDECVSVAIEGDQLVIRMGINYVQHAGETYVDFVGETSNGDEINTLQVTDARVFCQEIVKELQEEQEDGTTLVHIALDEAIRNAMENGCEGVADV